MRKAPLVPHLSTGSGVSTAGLLLPVQAQHQLPEEHWKADHTHGNIPTSTSGFVLHPHLSLDAVSTVGGEGGLGYVSSAAFVPPTTTPHSSVGQEPVKMLTLSSTSYPS